MKFSSIFIVLCLISYSAFAQVNPRCTPEKADEIPVYSGDFNWGMSMTDIADKANEMYSSGKRLKKRAFYDSALKSYVFPFDAERGGNVKIPGSFVKAIQRHVEKAFERGYVDALMFPDMGHSHFIIPEDIYQKVIDPIPVNQFNVLYEKMLAMKEMKVVYHTAEQIKVMDGEKKLLDNKKLQWRYYTRNLIGQNLLEPDLEIFNATAQSVANTVGEVEGYHWWGGGFNINASKDGCFSFVRAGKTFYFDLSLYDLESSPGSGSGD